MDICRMQDRMRANMKFIGHLFLRQLLSAKVIGSVICALDANPGSWKLLNILRWTNHHRGRAEKHRGKGWIPTLVKPNMFPAKSSGRPSTDLAESTSHNPGKESQARQKLPKPIPIGHLTRWDYLVVCKAHVNLSLSLFW